MDDDILPCTFPAISSAYGRFEREQFQAQYEVVLAANDGDECAVDVVAVLRYWWSRAVIRSEPLDYAERMQILSQRSASQRTVRP